MSQYSYFNDSTYDPYTSGPNFSYIFDAPGLPLSQEKMGFPVTRDGSHYDLGPGDTSYENGVKLNTINWKQPNQSFNTKTESFGNDNKNNNENSASAISFGNIFSDNRIILFIILFAFLWMIMSRLEYVSSKLMKIKKKLKDIKGSSTHVDHQ